MSGREFVLPAIHEVRRDVTVEVAAMAPAQEEEEREEVVVIEEEEASLLRTLVSDTESYSSSGGGGEEEDEGKDEEKKKKRRDLCWDGCGRPCTVCLCPYLPPAPLLTSTHVFVLHHPHEHRHPLSTLPVLSRCLLRCHPLPGRRLRTGLSPLLDSLHQQPLSLPSSTQALFLFPSPDPSTDLARWAAQNPLEARKDTVLIVFDGTWRHAREMVAASRQFLSRFARQVSLGIDVGTEGASTFDSELVLRKEPFAGCVSTVEAVARSLRAIEPDEGVAAEVERTLLDALRAMVRFQAHHLKPMKARPRMKKKTDDGKETRGS